MSIKVKFITLILIIGVMLTISTITYAGSVPDFDGIASQAKNFIEVGQSGNKIPVQKIAEIIKPIARILLGIGTVIVVVVAVVMGIKYVTGTPDQQAKLKTQLIGLAVSIFVLYGAYGIWSLAYTFMTSVVE